MNLYLISQQVNNDYDTYDSAVVCAESEELARAIHPGGYEEDVPEGPTTGTWTSQGNVKVELIGTASKSVKPGVVLASFNAG